MGTSGSFAEVLEAIDRLPVEDQEALVAIVQRRAAERGRQRIIAEAREARREFDAGECRTVGPDDLMGEILS